MLEAEGGAAIPPKERLRRTPPRRPAGPGRLRLAGRAYETIEVKVPDIGDFKDVPVIEILVKEGDEIERRGPADDAGIRQGDDGDPVAGGRHRRRFRIKVGDRVSQGDTILTLRTQAAAKPTAPPTMPPRRPGRRRRASPPVAARAISMPRCWCWARGRAATPPRSAPPIWASRLC